MSKLTVFSQINTDSLRVRCFTKEEVLTIIKDVKSGDLAKKELQLSNKEIIELDSIISKKDSIISTFQTKKLSYEEALKFEGERFKVIDDKLKEIEKSLKISKTTNQVITIGGVGLLGFLLGILIVK
jgi:hypothetical protein